MRLEALKSLYVCTIWTAYTARLRSWPPVHQAIALGLKGIKVYRPYKLRRPSAIDSQV